MGGGRSGGSSPPEAILARLASYRPSAGVSSLSLPTPAPMQTRAGKGQLGLRLPGHGTGERVRFSGGAKRCEIAAATDGAAALCSKRRGELGGGGKRKVSWAWVYVRTEMEVEGGI